MRFFGLGSKNSHGKPPSSGSSSIKTVSSSSSLSEQEASVVSIHKHFGVVPIITIVEPDQSDSITPERKNPSDNAAYKRHSRERQKPKYTQPPLVRPPRSIAETLAQADGLMAYRSRPPSVAGSLYSGTHSISRNTTVARGFHEVVASLPDPTPIDPSIKLVLGHGKDGSRPAFSLASQQRRSARHRR